MYRFLKKIITGIRLKQVLRIQQVLPILQVCFQVTFLAKGCTRL